MDPYVIGGEPMDVGSERQRWSTASKVAGGLFVASLLLGGGLLLAVFVGLQTRDVGPDADEMARDPLLHLHLDGASAGELWTSQGHEGGPAPALANSISSASRVWELQSDDEWQPALRAAVTAADERGTRWRMVSCRVDSVSFDGSIVLSIEGEETGATVWITLRNIESSTEPIEISIELSSDGEHSGGPMLTVPDDLYLGKEACAPEVVALAEEVRS